MGKAIIRVEFWRRLKNTSPCRLSGICPFKVCGAKYLLMSEEKVSTFIEDFKLKARHEGYNMFCERLYNIGFKKESKDRKHEKGILLEVIMPEKQKSDNLDSLLMFPDKEMAPLN